MSFGFPAYHTEEYEAVDSRFDLQTLVVDAIRDLHWLLLTDSDDVITASTNVSLWSWGENITITFESREIHSETFR